MTKSLILMNFVVTVSTLIALATSGQGKEIVTNEVRMANAPEWLTQTRVESVTERIQQKLEWSTRKIEVRWYAGVDEFSRAHLLGPGAIAVTVGQGDKAVVHLGPRVLNSNFDQTFGHEMVHVIIIQKYKDAIPKWLEEGLANNFAKHGTVDYKWLARHAFPNDVKSLAHPMMGTSEGISYRYEASQALAEMLDKKCGLENLVRLSVGRKMENYIETYCEIKDLNAAFRTWVKQKSGT